MIALAVVVVLAALACFYAGPMFAAGVAISALGISAAFWMPHAVPDLALNLVALVAGMTGGSIAMRAWMAHR